MASPVIGRLATDAVSSTSPEGGGIMSRFRNAMSHASDCLDGVTSGFTPIEVPPKYGNEKTHALCKALGATAGLGVDTVVGLAGAAEIGVGGAVTVGTGGAGVVVGGPAIALGTAQIGVATAGAVIHGENLAEATTTLMASEHTKGKRKSTSDKHTKPRSGRRNTKNRGHDNWVQNPNKKK